MDQFIVMIRSFHMGFWLGVFDKESIQMIARHYYDNQEKYLDEDYNRSGLFEWEKRAINDQFGECRRLLVAGAGGGGRSWL